MQRNGLRDREDSIEKNAFSAHIIDALYYILYTYIKYLRQSTGRPESKS